MEIMERAPIVEDQRTIGCYGAFFVILCLFLLNNTVVPQTEKTERLPTDSSQVSIPRLSIIGSSVVKRDRSSLRPVSTAVARSLYFVFLS